MSKISKKAAATVPSIDLLRSGVQQLDPDVSTEGMRIAIAAARFNAPIVDRLIDGALQALAAAGVAADAIVLVRVPGAWELPVVAHTLAETQGFDAIIALGCVIRGDTAHFDVISNESARGLMQVSLEHAIPVGNGVLACDNEQQALDRAGGVHGNKGAEAAQAALETLGVVSAIDAAYDQMLDGLGDLEIDEDLFR